MSPLVRRLARAAVAAVVAALVGLTAAQHTDAARWSWLELSRYLPFPVLLVPAVAALVVSLWLGRAWLLASSAVVVMVVTVTMGLVWRSPDRADAGDVGIRMMTYNVKAYLARYRAGGVDGIALEVARHDTDILVMQDANGLVAVPASGPIAPVFGLPHVYAAGQYVIASRFPLRDCTFGRLGDGGDGGYDPRFLRCTVLANGVAIDLVTVHFESPRSGLNAARREGVDGIDDWRHNYADRVRQAQSLARDLRGGPRPLILAGDLNAPESSPVVRALLAAGLRDAFSSAGRGYGYTHGHALRLGFSFLRIDHILVSRELGVTQCVVGGASASEHRPVIADLLLRRL